MRSLHSCPILYLLTLCLLEVSDALLVSGDNVQYCEVYGTTLQCDFVFSAKDVRVDDSANKFKIVLVKNTHQLLLHEGFCTSLNLYHITSVISISSGSNSDPESKNCEWKALHLHNTTIDHIPPSLHTLSMENSRLTETFTHQPYLKKIKVVNSYIRQLYIDSEVRGFGEVRLHNTTISSLAKLAMADNSKFFLTDSVVEVFDPQSVILSHNSSAEIMRTTFLQKQEAKIVHQEGATIIMANITGLFSVSYRKEEDLTSMTHDGAITAEKQPFSCSAPQKKTRTMAILIVTLVVLLAASITINMFVVWLLKRGKRDERGTRRTKIVRDIQEEEEGIRRTKIVLLSNERDLF